MIISVTSPPLWFDSSVLDPYKAASRGESQTHQLLGHPHLIVDIFSFFQNCRFQGLQRDVTIVQFIEDILQGQLAAL